VEVKRARRTKKGLGSQSVIQQKMVAKAFCFCCLSLQVFSVMEMIKTRFLFKVSIFEVRLE
jgi:hypothetical protein